MNFIRTHIDIDGRTKNMSTPMSDDSFESASVEENSDILCLPEQTPCRSVVHGHKFIYITIKTKEYSGNVINSFKYDASERPTVISKTELLEYARLRKGLVQIGCLRGKLTAILQYRNYVLCPYVACPEYLEKISHCLPEQCVIVLSHFGSAFLPN